MALPAPPGEDPRPSYEPQIAAGQRESRPGRLPCHGPRVDDETVDAQVRLMAKLVEKPLNHRRFRRVHCARLR